ncbi:MAG: LUD domain-containing protein, partial [Chloroflexota bacterium]|nr:LUD domain-containing protein [Chloroflexota bacterium]
SSSNHSVSPAQAGAQPPARPDSVEKPPPSDLLAQLERTAALQSWHFTRAADENEAAASIVEIAKEHGAGRVVRTAHDVLERMALDAALTEAGMESVLLAETLGGLDAQARQDTAAAAAVGVTGVDAVIAETASVALVPRRGMSRQASLLPPVHVAVATADQVVASLDDVLALRLDALAEAEEATWYMNLVSGPSRTADIEQTLVVGVHGPGVVYLVVIGE